MCERRTKDDSFHAAHAGAGRVDPGCPALLPPRWHLGDRETVGEAQGAVGRSLPLSRLHIHPLAIARPNHCSPRRTGTVAAAFSPHLSFMGPFSRG